MPTPTPRPLLALALAIAALLPLASPLTAAPAEPFPAQSVSLLPGPFLDSLQLSGRYLLQHDTARLLAPFLTSAGLEPKAQKYSNWESSGLDGHTAGHYLSALATHFVATGDTVYAERLDYMLAELERCQNAHGDGYLGGVPGGREAWNQLAAGQIKAERFNLNGAWVPWYNLHKTYAGLRDAWVIADRPLAKKLLLALTDWTYHLTEPLADEQMQRMLYAEHGGMNEIFADLYQRLGDPRHLRLALRFSDQEILQPLAQSQDKLDGFHANTQIPKVLGFQQIALASDQPQHAAAARYFWQTVVHNRSVAIGGNSVREHFHPANDFSSMLESREGPESCNTHNMLRLTEALFRAGPDREFADYYERALFNHILSVQHPQTGGLVYFTPMRPRHYRVYSVAENAFWCCVGSGMENPGRYSEFIYSQAPDQLYVNLFIPSRLTWPEQGLALAQTTEFPAKPTTRLQLETLDAPSAFTIALRRPAWATDAYAIRVNGKSVPAQADPDGYVRLRRTWSQGDAIDIDLPMALAAEPLPDRSGYHAFLYGPIVLAARAGTEDMPGLFAGDGRMDHIAPGPYLPLDQAPTLVGDPDKLASRLQPVPGQPLRFQLGGEILPAPAQPIVLEPFNQLHESRYTIYWRAATAETYQAMAAKLASEEEAKLALAARVIDSVAPGEQQSEVEHDFRGEDTHSDSLVGKRFREATQWFEYTLDPHDATAAEVSLTFFGSQWGRACAIEVDGQEIGRLESNGQHPEKFVDATFPLPPALLQNRATPRLTIRIKTFDHRATPSIFSLSLLTPQP